MGIEVVRSVRAQSRKGFEDMNDEIFETIKLMRETRATWLEIFKKYERELNLKTISDIRLGFGREMNKRGIILEHKDAFQRYREFMQD